MLRTRKLAFWAVAFGLLSVLSIEAQPGGGGGGGRGRGGFGRGMSPDQIFGLLAFNEKFNVTDEQLLELRGGLQPLYVEQQQAMEDLFSGEVDFQELRETMREMQMEMRIKIMGSLSEVLDEEQIETLKAHMKEQQERRSRFGGGGGPRGGGGGGGF
jgi:hypothetical protein